MVTSYSIDLPITEGGLSDACSTGFPLSLKTFLLMIFNKMRYNLSGFRLALASPPSIRHTWLMAVLDKESYPF